MFHLRRATIVAVVVSAILLIVWILPGVLNPTPPSPEERRRDQRWVDTSPYFFDRQACRWLGLCGIHHIASDPPARPGNDTRDGRDDLKTISELRRRALEQWEGQAEKTGFWKTARGAQGGGQKGEKGGAKILQDIPDYVLSYAPLVHLYSGEYFWPSDIAEHVQHMTPYANGDRLNHSEPVSLSNMHELNALNPTVFLVSNDNVETRPAWLHSHTNRPVPFDDDDDDGENGGGDKDGRQGERARKGVPGGETTWWDVDRDHPPHRISDPRRLSKLRGRRDQHPMFSESRFPPHHKPDASGYSKAPSVLILVDKGAGILDAFWFFFYSYNLGQTVAGIRFGNHVGDWEHCMVRFEHGVPRAMFLSEHAGGKAYAWSALEKRAAAPGSNKPERPVIYSAVGSHAMYAMPGDHPYVLPFKMLKDQTDRGPLWDPSLNHYAYWYDYEADRTDDPQNPTSLTPAATNPRAETSWFHFTGPWGDDILDLSDERQWRIFGEYHYVEGPLGPKAKWLDRRVVCQTTRCKIMYSLEEGKKSAWYS